MAMIYGAQTSDAIESIKTTSIGRCKYKSTWKNKEYLRR